MVFGRLLQQCARGVRSLIAAVRSWCSPLFGRLLQQCARGVRSLTAAVRSWCSVACSSRQCAAARGSASIPGGTHRRRRCSISADGAGELAPAFRQRALVHVALPKRIYSHMRARAREGANDEAHCENKNQHSRAAPPCRCVDEAHCQNKNQHSRAAPPCRCVDEAHCQNKNQHSRDAPPCRCVDEAHCQNKNQRSRAAPPRRCVDEAHCQNKNQHCRAAPPCRCVAPVAGGGTTDKFLTSRCGASASCAAVVVVHGTRDAWRSMNNGLSVPHAFISTAVSGALTSRHTAFAVFVAAAC